MGDIAEIGKGRLDDTAEGVAVGAEAASAQSHAGQRFPGGMESSVSRAAVLLMAGTHGAPSEPALGGKRRPRQEEELDHAGGGASSSGVRAVGKGSIAAAGAGYGYRWGSGSGNWGWDRVWLWTWGWGMGVGLGLRLELGVGHGAGIEAFNGKFMCIW